MTVNQPFRVVVLGGSGFIGRRLAHRLRAKGRQVFGYSSSECDLLAADQARRQLADCNEHTAVVVCSGVSRLVEDSCLTFHKNVSMARNVIGALEALKPRCLVFLSSADVYGLPAAELPIRETTLPRPNTYYGLSKLTSEFLFSLARLSFPVARLRLPGIYGPGDGGRSMIGTFCHRLRQNQTVPITGDGATKRDYVHVDDLCEVIDSLITNPVDDTINIATGVSTSILLLVEKIAEMLGVVPDISRIPAASDRDHDLAFDAEYFRRRFPRIELRTVEAGIRDYIAACVPESDAPA